MSRAATRSRVPLGQRQLNVDNNNTNNGGSTKSTILPSKKDSRSTLQRTVSTTSTAGSEISSSTNGGEANRAVTSISSDTLRRAISSGSSSSSDVATASADQKMMKQQHKSKPLSTKQPNIVRTTNVPSTTKSNSNSSNEPITIVEHRKRPCGDGYTVHKYIRGKMLGKGGFAKVYKVTSLDTNKEYAVKIVPKANLVKSRARQKVSTLLLLPHLCFVRFGSFCLFHILCALTHASLSLLSSSSHTLFTN